MSGRPKRCVRQVHCDKRGLFIYWFGYILRPNKTIIIDDEWVTVCWNWDINGNDTFSIVSANGHIETWKWEHRIYDMPVVPEGLTHVP